MKRDSDFDHKVSMYAKHIVYGTFLAVDPGSVSPGYALFHAGELVESGVLKLPTNSSIQERLQALAVKMRGISPVPPDVFAVEKIRGAMAHVYLQWSVGVVISSAQTLRVLEIPIYYWKAHVKKYGDYAGKSDVADAVAMGRTILRQAKEVLNVEVNS